MAEPRYNKEMEGEPTFRKGTKKTTKYIKLGKPGVALERNVCPGGDNCCLECVSAVIFSPEKLLEKSPEQSEEEKCAGCTDDRTCFDEAGILCKKDEMR